MTEKKIREEILSAFKSFLGAVEGDSKTPWREIIDIYNQEARCQYNYNRWGTRSLKMLDSYGWCATSVSSAVMKASKKAGIQFNSVAPIEMGPAEIMNMAKANGIWQAKGNTYGPQPADYVLMKGNGVSGYHIGMIVSRNGKALITIEGNTSNNIVEYKNRSMDDANILGYVSPLYCTIATKDPEITKVDITDVDDTGYTVTAEFTAAAGLDKVQMPTWTKKNDQDDLIWHIASVTGNTATYRVKTEDHNGEAGTYYTHVYVFDKNGQFACQQEVIEVPEKIEDVVMPAPPLAHPDEPNVPIISDEKDQLIARFVNNFKIGQGLILTDIRKDGTRVFKTIDEKGTIEI